MSATPDGNGEGGAPSRRERILEVAARLFYERGYDATGIDDIGAAAGITGPGVYRHFASKEDLLDTLVRERGTVTLDDVQRIAVQDAEPEVVLDQLIASYVDTILDNREVSVIGVYERRMLPVATRAWVERSERLLAAEWVHALTRLRPELTDAEAAFTVNAALNMAMAACTYRSGLPRDEVAALLRGMLRAALLP